ncbi:MAG: NusG domain II-containing protein [Clostridium sp.]
MFNKKDIKLILVILIISIGMFMFYKIVMPKGDSIEIIHMNEIIKTVDSNNDDRHEIKGSYGKMIVEVKGSKVRITEEECPNHICASIGWIEKDSYMPIVCMPNDILVAFKVQGNE